MPIIKPINLPLVPEAQNMQLNFVPIPLPQIQPIDDFFSDPPSPMSIPDLVREDIGAPTTSRFFEVGAIKEDYVVRFQEEPVDEKTKKKVHRHIKKIEGLVKRSQEDKDLKPIIDFEKLIPEMIKLLETIITPPASKKVTTERPPELTAYDTSLFESTQPHREPVKIMPRNKHLQRLRLIMDSMGQSGEDVLDYTEKTFKLIRNFLSLQMEGYVPDPLPRDWKNDNIINNLANYGGFLPAPTEWYEVEEQDNIPDNVIIVGKYWCTISLIQTVVVVFRQKHKDTELLFKILQGRDEGPTKQDRLVQERSHRAMALESKRMKANEARTNIILTKEFKNIKIRRGFHAGLYINQRWYKVLMSALGYTKYEDSSNEQEKKGKGGRPMKKARGQLASENNFIRTIECTFRQGKKKVKEGEDLPRLCKILSTATFYDESKVWVNTFCGLDENITRTDEKYPALLIDLNDLCDCAFVLTYVVCYEDAKMMNNMKNIFRPQFEGQRKRRQVPAIQLPLL